MLSTDTRGCTHNTLITLPGSLRPLIVATTRVRDPSVFWFSQPPQAAAIFIAGPGGAEAHERMSARIEFLASNDIDVIRSGLNFRFGN